MEMQFLFNFLININFSYMESVTLKDNLGPSQRHPFLIHPHPTSFTSAETAHFQSYLVDNCLKVIEGFKIAKFIDFYDFPVVCGNTCRIDSAGCHTPSPCRVGHAHFHPNSPLRLIYTAHLFIYIPLHLSGDNQVNLRWLYVANNGSLHNVN